jgi:predicted RND superfamily exporter protein
MLEMLVVANSAFAIIKQTIQNGKELSSAGAAIANFVSAEEQLKQDLSKKKNSIWTNFLGKTDNDLEEFMALEEIRVKNDQLREFMQLYGRANLYNDYISFCADARKARRDARIKAEKRKEQIKETVMKVILAILITGLLSGVVTVLAIIAKKKGII